MAYVPNSPYFLLSNIKVEFRDMVLQGICTALGCTEVSFPPKLSGRLLIFRAFIHILYFRERWHRRLCLSYFYLSDLFAFLTNQPLSNSQTREVDMAGKQPASLLDLLVNKHSQVRILELLLTLP